MHFRPPKLVSPETGDLPPLPPGKTAVSVLSDFMRYLFQCTQTFIQEKEPSGESLWASVRNDIEFILTHPNGWEGAQQTQIREAAVLAGLAPDIEDANGRTKFVTEGEASLHFAIRHGFPKEELEVRVMRQPDCGSMHDFPKPGEGVIILDAGGGTIDASTYAKKPEGWYEEIAPAQCEALCSLLLIIHSILSRPFPRFRLRHPCGSETSERFVQVVCLRSVSSSQTQNISRTLPSLTISITSSTALTDGRSSVSQTQMGCNLSSLERSKTTTRTTTFATANLNSLGALSSLDHGLPLNACASQEGRRSTLRTCHTMYHRGRNRAKTNIRPALHRTFVKLEMPGRKSLTL